MRYKPVGSREFQSYVYLVIKETDENRRSPHNNLKDMDYFHVGQIIVCDITGGTPIEVGTHAKPGKLNCRYEQFETIYDAIDYAYEVGVCGFDRRGEGRHKNTWQRKRRGKKRQNRHQA